MVEIVRRVSRSFQLQPFRQLVFHPLRTGMDRRVEQQALSLREMFHECVLPTFPKCGKDHLGECLIGKERCFGCGQFGHRLRDCPTRRKRKMLQVSPHKINSHKAKLNPNE